MAEYTTKKEKLIVPGSVIKEYNKTQPLSQIYGTDFAGDQYYDYRLNTETGVTEIFRDSPFKIFDRKPSNIIAVTGTNGKSSVADFYYQILDLNNKKSASIGTLGVKSKKYNYCWAINGCRSFSSFFH